MGTERRVQSATGPSLAVTVSGEVGATTVPVVLVHGMGGDRSTWRTLARELRRRDRTVVSFDLRGHGRTGAGPSYDLADFRDDLGAVVDHLATDRVDLVGHSLGAHTALRYAMGEPERVRRMVLEEVPPMPRNDDDLAEAITPAASLGERVRGIRSLLANPAPFLRFDRALGGPVTDAFTRVETHWWCGLSKVTAPTLVISGGDRSFLPPQHLRDVAYALPSGDFLTIEAGHSVHRDRPREFARAAVAHLDI